MPEPAEQARYRADRQRCAQEFVAYPAYRRAIVALADAPEREHEIDGTTAAGILADALAAGRFAIGRRREQNDIGPFSCVPAARSGGAASYSGR